MQIKYPTVRCQSVYPIKKVVNASVELPKEFILIEKVGQGSFGEIFKIYNTETKTLHAAKVEFKDSKQTNQQPLLIKEYKVFQALKGISQVPQPYQLIQQREYNIIIMPFFGTGNLEEIRKKQTNGRLSKDSILKLAHSLIHVIEQVHEKKYIHRDIKPENFIIGSMGDHHSVYLIDYGLAKPYMDSSNVHIPLCEGKGMVGTARYTSINSHRGLEQSRRDDLEAICYVLMYLYLGQLPWQNFNCNTRQEKFQKILDQKNKFACNLLEVDIPIEIRKVFDHVLQLQFEQAPDYKLLKSLVANKVNCYDWCPMDCKIRATDEIQDQISELSSEQQWKQSKATYNNTETNAMSKKFTTFEQIEEEDEESLSELKNDENKLYVFQKRH